MGIVFKMKDCRFCDGINGLIKDTEAVEAGTMKPLM